MTMTRRSFVACSAGCASYLAAAAPLLSAPALRRWSGVGARRIVAQTPFARIEELGEGLFAIISTPLNGDYTTVCNGGIVGGTSGTLMVEAFATPEGARWAAEQARELTGGWPTQVVVSHYHGDHSAGPAGYADGEDGSPQLRATAATRNLVRESPGDEAAKVPWADVVLVPEDGPVEIDLGGRTVAVVPRGGPHGERPVGRGGRRRGTGLVRRPCLERDVPQLHGRRAVPAVPFGARPAGDFGRDLRARARAAGGRGSDGALRGP